jgi:hypothetical protein
MSDKDIRKSFTRLISDPKIYKNHYFCFFIDGLDEYETTHQEDAKDLVDLLCSRTTLGREKIKICVSSREHNVFMNAFSAEQRIRLHDLTRGDMRRYALEKLRHLGPESKELVSEIVDNAQGIFLWVALVVNRVREQIENGADIDTLEREIHFLPKELDGLFEHILNSLVDVDLLTTYQTFSMVSTLNEENTLSQVDFVLTLLSYSFLDEYSRDPLFATQEDFRHRSIDKKERDRRITKARKQLNGSCGGLVEVRRQGEGRRPWAMEDDGEAIVIGHRTILEFLSKQTKKAQIERRLDKFNALDAISQLTLAELWSRDPGDIRLGGKFDRLALGLTTLRIHAKLDQPPYAFLETLGLAWQRHQTEGNYDCHGRTLGVTTCYWDFRCDVEVDQIPSLHEDSDDSEQVLRHPIYPLALMGSYDYVQWKLNHNPGEIPLFTPLRLIYCIIGEFYRNNLGENKTQGLLKVLDCLHVQGIGPQTPSTLFKTRLHPVTANQELRRKNRFGDPSTVITLWHHILLRSFRAEATNKPDRQPILGYIVEKFLEYGADPYFYMSVTISSEQQTKLVHIIVRIGGEIRDYWFNYHEAMYEEIGTCENKSLEDMVERWSYENKARVLELIRKNRKMLEGLVDSEVTSLKAE